MVGSDQTRERGKMLDEVICTRELRLVEFQRIFTVSYSRFEFVLKMQIVRLIHLPMIGDVHNT